MSIQVTCPSRDCDQTLSLSPEMAGKKGQCPKCGKSFQIPKILGGGQSDSSTPQPATRQPSKPESSSPKTAPTKSKPKAETSTPVQKPAAPAEKPQRSRTPQQSPTRRGPEKIDESAFSEMLVEEDEPENIVEPEEVFAEDFGAPQRSRPARRRPRDDYDDDDDDYRPLPSRKSGGLSPRKRWKLAGIGMMIMSISTCVFAASFALTVLSELMIQFAPVANSGGMGRGGLVIYQVAQGFAIPAFVGFLVGAIFLVFAPSKYGSIAFAIGTVVFGITNFVLQLIFIQIPTFKEELLWGRFLQAGAIGGALPGKYEALGLFLELFVATGFVLTALFMAMVARSQKNRRHRNDCMQVVWLLCGYAGLLLLMYIFMFINSNQQGDWIYYLIRVLNWGANGFMVMILIMYIQNLFYSAKTTG